MEAKGDIQPGGSAERQQRFSRDTILEILSNRRRRFALYYLKQQQNRSSSKKPEVPLRELADQVASWENEKPIDDLTEQERKRVQNALQQFHLSKLVDQGFVVYDPGHGVVRLTDAAAETDFYVDVLSDRSITWGFYYVLFTGISAVCLAGIAIGIYPFSLFSPMMWSLFFVTAFGISAFGHYYDNKYRMRLGAREKPPEVDRP